MQGADQAASIAMRAGSAQGLDRARVNKFQGIQTLLGGDLEGTRFLKPAQEAAQRVSQRQLTQLLGGELNPQQIENISKQQAANMFKGTPMEQMNRGLTSLDKTIQESNRLTREARMNNVEIGQYQMQAAQNQESRRQGFLGRQSELTATSRRNAADFRGAQTLSSAIGSEYDEGDGHYQRQLNKQFRNIDQRTSAQTNVVNNYNYNGQVVNNPSIDRQQQELWRNIKGGTKAANRSFKPNSQGYSVR